VSLLLSLLWLPLVGIRAAAFFAHGMWSQATAASIAVLVGMALPWLLRATGSLVVFGNAVALVWFSTLTSLSVQRGGIGSPALIALGVVPLGATFMAGSRSGITWGSLVALEVICFYLLERAGVKLPDRLPAVARTATQALGALLFAVALTWLAVAYERTTSAAVDALHRAEQDSRALLGAIPDVGFRMNRDGVTLAVYGRREQLGKAPAWSPGVSVEDVAPELAVPLGAAIEAALESGEVVRAELEATVGDERRQYEARLAPSGPDEVFVLLRDLTETRRLARRLSRVEHEANLLRADRMASVGQLAAAVAHEANNPLAYVIANLSFVQDRLGELGGAELEAARPALEEAIAESRQGADRVRQIVRDLKTFARADEEELRPLHVAQVMDSTLKMAATEIRHRARLERRYGDVPLVVANEGRLAQVFLNVVVNAAQAIEPGRAESNEIRVVLDRDSTGAATVVVTDTGTGIAAEHLARVTEPFFTTKPIGVGTGLGLTVCKNIVEGYGGKLEFLSELGAGTTVRITLPAAPEGAVVSARSDTVALPPAKIRYRVLAIDDDPLVLKALRRVLRDYDLTTTQGGHEALALIRDEQPFHVILCDLMMPEITGIDVYREVHAMGRGLEKRIVFLTGGAFTEQARGFLATVPNHRLDKPFSPEQLERMIRRTADDMTHELAPALSA
jgi:signal transduction histidine kinase/ActR/RegA family two-component response regulator